MQYIVVLSTTATKENKMFAVYYTRNGVNGRKVFNSLKKRNEWVASAPSDILIVESR